MMRLRILFLVTVVFTATVFPQFKQLPPHFRKITIDDQRFTSVGNIGLTISNYGTFGDGFVQQTPVDFPSCEYPRGSGIEHMFDGGLWVGAETPQGIRVTTGAFNSARIQTGGALNFEFTNSDDPTDIIIERSSLEQSKYYDPEAISHQDFIINFVDTNRFVPGTSIPIPQHVPLGISVHLETYAWNFPFADAFVIFNYTITNVGYADFKDTLKNVYVGLWADLVVRNVNITPPRVGAPFYMHVGNGYVDTDTMKFVYAYDYDGDPGYTDSYVAMVFLGAEPQADDRLYNGQTTYNFWLFSGGDNEFDRPPADEASRYERMKTSIDERYFYNNIYQTPGNRMALISTGPFERIAPDSSINVVFAIVCAKKYGFRPSTIDDDYAKRNLFENVSWALRAFYGEDTNRNGKLDYAGTDSTEDVNGNGKLDRFVLPTPPLSPRFKAIPGNQKVTLLWDRSAEESIDLISKEKDFEGYRIYRSFLGDDRSPRGIFEGMQLIREFDIVDGVFYDTGLDEIRLDEPIEEIVRNPETGEMDTIRYYYKYEVTGLHNGWQYAFAVTAFDRGDEKLRLQSLESSRLRNVAIVSPGTPPRKPNQPLKVGVYPNPYRVNALWDGTQERERKLYFYNLPRNCEVRIYTLAGDLVDSFIHRGDDYRGMDIKWYESFSQGNTIFPGGEHAWDLVTQHDQAIATGLYLFTVKDLDTGEIYRGKFVVIK
ncbi:MAG: hypothetical protein GXO78_06085 [Calditrichaeota bacterium]|nr:hypothetical protein [Calditrichota bacterium]